MPPATAYFYEQLGWYRETLVTANTPQTRERGSRWLRTTLLGTNQDESVRGLPAANLLDSAIRGNPSSWHEVLRFAAGELVLPSWFCKDDTPTITPQIWIMSRIARRIVYFHAYPRGEKRTAARDWLTAVFLRVNGKRRARGLDPDDVASLYQMCLDWVSRLDRPIDGSGDANSHEGTKATHSLRPVDVGDAKSRLPPDVWRAINVLPNKRGAHLLAGYLLGCSAEYVRRTLLRPGLEE